MNEAGCFGECAKNARGEGCPTSAAPALGSSSRPDHDSARSVSSDATFADVWT